MDAAQTASIAAGIVSAWLANPSTRATPQDAADFYKAAHGAVAGVTSDPVEPETETARREPAVTVRQSLAKQPEFIISMMDGKPYKSLRRHINKYGMTPDDYRQEFGLKPDYPMVATAFSERRSAMAKSIGLGRIGKTKEA